MSHQDSFSSQYQGTPPAVFYYTCPWTVTPAAKDQLEIGFTNAIEDLGLTTRLSYDHDKHFFKIDCLPKEKAMVYSMFSRVIDDFLTEQVGPDVKEESTLATKIGPIPFSVRTEAKEAVDEGALEGFLRTEWSCPRIEQLGGVFDTKLLKQIGELTGCTLTYNSESRVIIVLGPNQEACHRAILKLDKVRDYEVPIYNNPYPNQAHLFYAEEHTEYDPVPYPLKRVHTLYETTLLDISAYPPTNLSPYLTVSKAATLRCAIYNEKRHALRPLPVHKEAPEPAIKEEQRGAEFRVFAKHRFARKGDVDPVVGVVEEEELAVGEEAKMDIALDKKAGIEVWVRGVEGNGAVLEDEVNEEKGLISPIKEVGESSRATEVMKPAPRKPASEKRLGSPAKKEVGARSRVAETIFNADAKNQSHSVSPVHATSGANAIPPHLRRLFSAPTPAPASAAQGTSILDMDIDDNFSPNLPSDLPAPLIELLTDNSPPLIDIL
ncbi:hypothetical protein V493_08426, partial [Pseudogymnoascus sp. VKM F-4281 (FW-2241)]